MDHLQSVATSFLAQSIWKWLFFSFFTDFFNRQMPEFYHAFNPVKIQEKRVKNRILNAGSAGDFNTHIYLP
jgi:hypothetical protein